MKNLNCIPIISLQCGFIIGNKVNVETLYYKIFLIEKPYWGTLMEKKISKISGKR
jgi:hypothetical protein